MARVNLLLVTALISLAAFIAPAFAGMVSKNKENSDEKGFVQDIESLAVKNIEFRRVIYTAQNCQFVVMSLKPGEEIGTEVRKSDQFFRVP